MACLEPLSSWPSLQQLLEKQEEDWPVHIQARANRGTQQPHVSAERVWRQLAHREAGSRCEGPPTTKNIKSHFPVDYMFKG